MDSTRVELPIAESSKLLSLCKTIGDIKKTFDLHIVKYIYLDPIDKKFKGVNPLDEIPVVPNSSITIIGSNKEIIRFTKEATQLET